MSATTPLLQVSDLTRSFDLPRASLFGPREQVQALRGVSLALEAGKSLGVVGESGSGKTTLARIVMALDRPTSGSVHFMGRNLHELDATQLREARRDFQMVFQDPYGSLDPRQTVERIITEPMAALESVGKAEMKQRAAEVLGQVGLRSTDAEKFPHEFSGGQRQRIAIARALITRPRLIIADEPVSALDVSVQAQVLNLMQDLQQQSGLSYLLISHDLAVVSHLADEVVVMHQGLIVERGTPAELFTQARHPYTQTLVGAVPQIAPGLARARRAARRAA